MPLRVIDAVDSARAAAELRGLRELLSPQGDVVTEAGRRKTLAAFGAPLTLREVVALILREVRSRGFPALREFTAKLDNFDLTAETLRVPAEQLAAAHAAARPEYLAALRTAAGNIRRFQEAIRHQDVSLAGADEDLGVRYLPVRRVGICVPGGAAAYPSTVLMAAIPAQVAGVDEIAVMAPPTAFGANNADLLAACHEVGVREVYRMGGAQGVAAFAYGVEGVPKADMIVGPGNLFVALAKQQVAGEVGIDMLAGPTEVLILADASANPEHVAADLISQAEHAPGASILVTWERGLVAPTLAAVERQLAALERGEQARESLRQYGAVALVADEAAGCALSDELAPEHLQLSTADPQATLRRVRNAGAIFVGPWTPVAVGDYLAGPSHTLPTGGAARFASPLSANTFLKASSILRCSRPRLAQHAGPLGVIAAVEGLTGHRRSVDIRLE